MCNFFPIFLFFSPSASLHSYLVVSLASSAIPAVVTMEVFFGMFSLIIPIMGRSGTELSPDVAIAVITSLFVCLYSQYLVSLKHTQKFMFYLLFKGGGGDSMLK